MQPDALTFAQHCMQRALALAARGQYTTRPNPRVGCVLTQGDRIIGEGFHAQAGQAHAEVHALQDAHRNGENTQGARAYVSLEPCAHTGRTPPCTDALLRAGISAVVIACLDPYDQVNGRGAERLRAAGVAVQIGLLQTEARRLNAGFFSRVLRHRPWLRLKLATSVDGRIALKNGASQWLTGPAARADGHRLRAQACAVLSGIGTVLTDDPALDARLDAAVLAELPVPLMPVMKIILDRAARLPAHARVVQSPGLTLQVHAQDVVSRLAPSVRSMPHDFTQADALQALLLRLTQEYQIQELHVEAGGTLAGALLAADLVDELVVYQAPLLLGPEAKAMAELPEASSLDSLARWQLLDVMQLDADVRLRYLSAAANSLLRES
jgi:diaminohydroxyphosphoribosylaminopyrimidine deaminase / 5-amino-6-(5-phosphoribosylamino)uracil reductase